MKKKIKIKGLPKAQYGTQNKPAPMVLAPQYLDTWKKDNPANPYGLYGEVNMGSDNMFTPALPMGQPLEMDKNFKSSPYQNWSDTSSDADVLKGFNQKQTKGVNQNALSLVGPAMLAGLSGISSLAKKAEQRNAQKEFKDQFLADNLYLSRPESISGNRGDYEINTGVFRPDDYVYGMYNKIAQMGGEMKRKVKITGLPQAEYGGTQNKNAVNQLYGNSAYMMNMFSQRQEQEPMQEYNQTLSPDPRSLSVIEAEKGETLIKTGENSTIPEFYKIGGKRHYEGGTPLGPDKATPNSFIYSDTKAMRIKDKDMLASFGLKAKKGGYTPAEISKKFNLNDKQLREGLYDEQDMLRKKTAIMQADNHIANLGKLALVQESQKGFPQGIPSIAYPYMEKIGMDPMSIMPNMGEQNMMSNYGNLPQAQEGVEVPTYSEDIRSMLSKLDKNVILPQDLVESLQPETTTGTYGRFDPNAANRNWSWYGKPIDYTKPEQVGPAMKAYNKEMYNRFIKAGYSPKLAQNYVEQVGFKEGIKGPNALDSKAGKYFESRVLFDPPPITVEPQQQIQDVRQLQQTADLSKGTTAKKRGTGLYPQDVLNNLMAVQNLASINKYLPRQVQFTPELMEPTFYDPTRELAANAEMANIAAQNLAQFTGPQSFNARYSDVQGKGLSNAANIMGRYNNLNVGVANQFETANKQLINEANFKNQLMADDFYTKTAIANQQYDNAKRQGTEQVYDAMKGTLDNIMYTNLLNQMYPQYYINPSALNVQYDPQAALALKSKTQSTDIDNQLKQYFPAFDKFSEDDKNTLRTTVLKKYLGSEEKDSDYANLLRAFQKKGK